MYWILVSREFFLLVFFPFFIAKIFLLLYSLFIKECYYYWSYCRKYQEGFWKKRKSSKKRGERGEVISYIVIVVYFLPVYKVDQPLLLGVVGVLRREIISVVEVVFEVLGHYFIVETRLFVCWFFIFLAITNTNITNIIINLLK